MANIAFDGKVAIVTGAGGGLGREHALELARRGARVVVNDVGGTIAGEGAGSGPADTTVRQIEELGGEAIADSNSVATPEGGEAIVKTALDAFGTVDILVNNAGILRDKSFHNMTPEVFNSVLEVHLVGTFNITRPAYSVMRKNAYGRIVNTSSNSGILGNFGQANYGAAKMGLVGLTRVLAVEGRRSNIMVNAIAPLAFTRMTEANLSGRDLAIKLEPKLVTPLVCWLASDHIDVSGELFSAAGGVVARYFIGLTPGYYSPQLTVESVRDNWGTIRNEEGYIVPEDSSGELDKLTAIFAAP